MAADPIVFAMANPTPEIMPDQALAAGAKVVGTGRSDFPNQINNVLAFPGIFRGALDCRARCINEEMKMAASHALAELAEADGLSQENILPDALGQACCPRRGASRHGRCPENRRSQEIKTYYAPWSRNSFRLPFLRSASGFAPHLCAREAYPAGEGEACNRPCPGRKCDMSGLSKVEVQGVTKAFGGGEGMVPALEQITFQVPGGGFTSLLGPSGCGKSTLFNIIAGLMRPDCGDVLLDGRSVIGKPGQVGYMLQKDLLLPWRSIQDNIILGARLRHVPREDALQQARALMERYGLQGFEKRKPHELSGGMRQRAALLRTLLTEREVLLLDEPFGALDALTRLQLQLGLTDVWQTFHKTILLVTHDVEEAIFLSDQILVLSPRPGRVRRQLTVPLPRPRTVDMLASPRGNGNEKRIAGAPAPGGGYGP